MSNSRNQTLAPSYSAEIVENERPVKLSPLLLNKKFFLVGQEINKKLPHGRVKISSTEQFKIFAILKARTVEGT